MEARPTAQQVIAWLGLEPQSFVAEAIAGGTFDYALLGRSVWGWVAAEDVERMELIALGKAFPQAQLLIRECLPI